jgi:hypothetical protein
MTGGLFGLVMAWAIFVVIATGRANPAATVEQNLMKSLREIPLTCS